MKKNFFAVTLAIVLVFVAIGGGYYWWKKVNTPPEVVIYQSKEDLDNAIKEFEKDRDSTKFTWQDSFSLGVAYIHAGRFEDAVKILEKVKSYRPSFDKTYESLGMAYYRLDKIEKAVEAWQKALELDPSAEHLKDMIERAKTKFEIKSRAEALKKEIGGGKAGWTKRLELAALYLALKEPDPAIVELKEILKTMKNRPEIYDAMAQAYAFKGDFENAISFEKKALALSPGDGNIKKRLSEMQKIKEAMEKDATGVSHGYQDGKEKAK